MKQTLALALLLACALQAKTAQSDTLRFQPAASNSFSFDTGVLRGTLRAGGASKGLTEVLHVPSGTRLDSSMGLFGLYRILGNNKRYGDAAWFWASEARLNDDGSVSVSWAPAKDRPFHLGATYRWSAPNMLDLETTIRADTESLPKLEVFLASYFSAPFTNAAVLTGRSEFARALPENTRWQAFPRDASAFSLVQDGRWTYPPNPVDWTNVRQYAKPLALRRANGPGITAIIMAQPSDCYAVMTPFETDPHRSLYLALFGKDAQPGKTLKARTRLVIGTDISNDAALKLYSEFSNPARPSHP